MEGNGDGPFGSEPQAAVPAEGDHALSPEELRLAARIIDGREVKTVFQPLVHLADGEVVGYEALARGPEGSSLELPLKLLGAARAIGRLEELDWVFAATAVSAASAARPHPSTTFFVNLEPSTFLSPCPEDLLRPMKRAETNLRVIAEMTERSLAEASSDLLQAIERLREIGWGIGIDNVGETPESLAMLAFVQPDVMKIDLAALRCREAESVAAIMSALRAQAERTGAVILTQGIETEEDALVARTLGATYGQGWRYGSPAPLPPEIRRGHRSPFPLIKDPGVSEATPFEIIAASRGTTRTEKRLLVPLSRYLEEQAVSLSGSGSLAVLACVQEARYLTPALRTRLAELAEQAIFTVVLGEGVGRRPVPDVRLIDLGPGDPLRHEWNLFVIGPHFAAALVARDCGDDGPQAERRFDFTLSYDRSLVLEAARSLLRWINPGS